MDASVSVAITVREESRAPWAQPRQITVEADAAGELDDSDVRLFVDTAGDQIERILSLQHEASGRAEPEREAG